MSTMLGEAIYHGGYKKYPEDRVYGSLTIQGGYLLLVPSLPVVAGTNHYRPSPTLSIPLRELLEVNVENRTRKKETFDRISRSTQLSDEGYQVLVVLVQNPDAHGTDKVAFEMMSGKPGTSAKLIQEAIDKCKLEEKKSLGLKRPDEIHTGYW